MIYEQSARRLRDRACQVFLAFIYLFIYFLNASPVVALIIHFKAAQRRDI